MAGLFDKQSDLYLDARPTYPPEWYSNLASHSLRHSLAWDVGTGNGQAAIGVAEYYDQVIGTDASEPQLHRAISHPKIRYLHTPPSLPDDDLVSLVGGGEENSVDLVTVAQAIHWFDLPRFYSVVGRLLKKPGGVIAVWCYNDIVVCPEFDAVFKKFHNTTLPFWHPNIRHVFDGYKNLPFPFEPIGSGYGPGGEGQPMELEIPKELSFEGVVRMVQSWSAVITARDQGVELLPENVVKEMETAWGGSGLVRPIVYKAFMLIGKVKLSEL